MSDVGGGQWQCNVCEYQSGSKFSVETHIEAKHIHSSGHTCPFCYKTFSTVNAFRIHKSRYHRSWVENIYLCFKLLFFYVDLIESLMTPLGGGLWQCVECRYQAKSTHLRYHIEAKHVQSGGYNCPSCPQKFFSTFNALKIHKSRYHKTQYK